MRPDGMLVESGMIADAMTAVGKQGTDKALAELASQERDLTAYIAHSAMNIAGKLALSGAPSEVVRGSHDDFLTVILTCVGALKRGHYELWKDTQVGSRLVEIDQTLKAPTKKRRRSHRSANSNPASEI